MSSDTADPSESETEREVGPGLCCQGVVPGAFQFQGIARRSPSPARPTGSVQPSSGAGNSHGAGLPRPQRVSLTQGQISLASS